MAQIYSQKLQEIITVIHNTGKQMTDTGLLQTKARQGRVKNTEA